MADLYVAASGSNTAPYDTWAKAATSLVTAVNAMAAGDRLYVENLFQDAATVGQTFTFPGGSTDPSYVYSVTNPGMVYTPATAYTYQSSGSGDITIHGKAVINGLYFDTGDNYTIGNGQAHLVFKDCTFEHVDRMQTQGDDGRLYFKNCEFKGVDNGSDWTRAGRANYLYAIGCNFTGYNRSQLFSNFGGDGTDTILDGCSFDSNIIGKIVQQSSSMDTFIADKCEWHGDVGRGQVTDLGGETVIQWIDSGPTQDVFPLHQYTTKGGTIEVSTSKYRTGGAVSKAGTPYAYELVTEVAQISEAYPLDTPWGSRFVQPGPQKIIVYLALDTLETLNDQQAWIEALSPPEGSTAQGKFYTTQGTPDATGVALTTDSDSTWNGSDVETTYKIELDINPAVAGMFKLRLFIAADTTDPIVFDPIIEVSY